MQIDFFAYNQKVDAVPKFGICDDAGKEKPAYIDYDILRSENWGALVQSENSQDYSFIAVDNNIPIPKPNNENQEESRCDAMLHTNKTIAFIELKDKRKTKAGEAAKQLKSTINTFKENHNIEDFANKEAYICNRAHPNMNITSNSLCDRFFEETGVTLRISRTIKHFD